MRITQDRARAIIEAADKISTTAENAQTWLDAVEERDREAARDARPDLDDSLGDFEGAVWDLVSVLVDGATFRRMKRLVAAAHIPS